LVIAESAAVRYDVAMGTVLEHYEALLAPHYSWMQGDFEARAAAQLTFLREHGVEEGGGRAAFDLGAGAGCHAIALAGLGYRVKAVDLSPTLVAEMRTRASGLEVEPILGDLVEFMERAGPPVPVVTCMGDTLTHLDSAEAVRRLFRAVRRGLDAKGRFIVTYRDLTTELRGTDRFIPVRADENTVFTCFLEYQGGAVTVHDIVHVREGAGWRMTTSAYTKLRLARADVERWLREAGFTSVDAASNRGLVEIVAR
jgi:SAM-dependent methyltransferase